MINLGDTVVGGEVILNSFQSQVFAEVVKKFEGFGISGYEINADSYMVQKELARFVIETVPVDEKDIREIPRFSQIVFQSITNPDLYDSEITDEGLLQWLEMGNPYSFFSKTKKITDLSGLANDARLIGTKVSGFRKNGTVNRNQVPSILLGGKRSFVNVSSVIDDLLEEDDDNTTNGLIDGTVEMWINLDKKGMGARNQYHTLFNAHCTGTPFGLHVQVGRNGELRIIKQRYDVERERIVEACYSDIRVIPFGQWIHVVVTFEEDGVICYVNTEGYKLSNEMRGQKPYDGMITGFMNGFEPLVQDDETIPLSPDKFLVGIQRTKDNKFRFGMDGRLSSFRIYETALEPEDIKANFEETKGQYLGE